MEPRLQSARIQVMKRRAVALEARKGSVAACCIAGLRDEWSLVDHCQEEFTMINKQGVIVITKGYSLAMVKLLKVD